jgi:hypothetical protein
MDFLYIIRYLGEENRNPECLIWRTLRDVNQLNYKVFGSYKGLDKKINKINEKLSRVL